MPSATVTVSIRRSSLPLGPSFSFSLYYWKSSIVWSSPWPLTQELFAFELSRSARFDSGVVQRGISPAVQMNDTGLSWTFPNVVPVAGTLFPQNVSLGVDFSREVGVMYCTIFRFFGLSLCLGAFFPFR